MAKNNKAKSPHQFTIAKASMVPQLSLNLEANDNFIVSHGIQFMHHKAIPSPIGLKQQGDYRRSGELDVQSSNGFLYKEHPCSLTAVFLGNSSNEKDIDGGVFDSAQARITLPRFYNTDKGFADGERIYLSPGDKLYIKDKSIDTKVANFQEFEYEPDRDNFLQYPAISVEFLIDSRGQEYLQERDFKITKDGKLRWISGGRNPGIDPDTGKGRVCSARYMYEAHWYIVSILNEVRIGNVTTGGVRKEERMPYHATIVREYIFFNRNRGDETKENKKLLKSEDVDRKQLPDQTNFGIPDIIKVNNDDD